MSRSRVDGQPAYVLHSYPFRETSLIVEVFSRDHGRVALLARGARRPRSVLRGLLLAFQPLELGWAGKGEVPTLMKTSAPRDDSTACEKTSSSSASPNHTTSGRTRAPQAGHWRGAGSPSGQGATKPQ